MRLIGFSTGALARNDFRHAISLMRNTSLRAVELSSLRDSELDELIDGLESLDLSGFDYISFHAPSKLDSIDEDRLIAKLAHHILPRRWPIIVHPDIMTVPEKWSVFGEWLCLENMDQRKPTGRTVDELEMFFRAAPNAKLCLDIGHSRQVDPTMAVTDQLLRVYSTRLRQLHISEVNPKNRHVRLSFAAIQAIGRFAFEIPSSCPVIIESTVSGDEMLEEVESTKLALQGSVPVLHHALDIEDSVSHA